MPTAGYLYLSDEDRTLCHEVLTTVHAELAAAWQGLDSWPIGFLAAVPSVDKDGMPKLPTIHHGGYGAYAFVRLTDLYWQTLLRIDAQIVVDSHWWNGLLERAKTDVEREQALARRRAVIDHELTHLELVCDKKTGKPVLHPETGRPKLRLRKHDYQFGWFTEVAQRHGVHSVEVQQAGKLRSEPDFWPAPPGRRVALMPERLRQAAS